MGTGIINPPQPPEITKIFMDEDQTGIPGRILRIGENVLKAPVCYSSMRTKRHQDRIGDLDLGLISASYWLGHLDSSVSLALISSSIK